MRFSRQEYWSGLLFLSPGDLPGPGIEPRSPVLQANSLPFELQGVVGVCIQLCLYSVATLWTVAHQVLCPWGFPGKDTGVGCHLLLQGIFPTQGLNLCLLHLLHFLHWQADSLTTVSPESDVAQSCQTLCDPVDCSLPGFSIHGILQARILEWVTISFSRGSSQHRDRTRVCRIGGRRFNL